MNYKFTAFVMGDSVLHNEIGFLPADFFSREIQGNKCGDPPASSSSTANDDGIIEASEISEWRGKAWHFPVNDWDYMNSLL